MSVSIYDAVSFEARSIVFVVVANVIRLKYEWIGDFLIALTNLFLGFYESQAANHQQNSRPVQ